MASTKIERHDLSEDIKTKLDKESYTKEEVDAMLEEAKAPTYTYGTEDLTPGESPLETGKLHFVYE